MRKRLKKKLAKKLLADPKFIAMVDNYARKVTALFVAEGERHKEVWEEFERQIGVKK